ncbi:hypothetical protein Tco_0839627 [Tanacetum coccineum]|uniref:Uncharacterized protein n=1 Tax=Tanacetum coccineum TaxID=301880 RepID=A0ABQ5AR72_9ASTR
MRLETSSYLSQKKYRASRRFNYFYDDDDEESSIHLRDIISKLPPSIAITSVLPTLEPEDSLIMGNEELSTIPKSTIPEKESDEFIKSSVEDVVPIPSESGDTSGSDSVCDLHSCDDFSPINVYKEKSVTFSNPLFDSNDDFTSSDDESLSDEDVPEDNIKIYSNPLFEFNDEYISSDVNPLFDEDEFFAPGDDIEFLLHRDPSTPTISVVSILEGFTDEPPLEENDDLFDLESKTYYLKKFFYKAPIDDLMTKDKIFDPRGDIDEIDAFLDVDISKVIKEGYHDSERDILYLESLLSNDTILSLLPKVFLDHDPKSLSDINDLKIMVKVFDPGIHNGYPQKDEKRSKKNKTGYKNGMSKACLTPSDNWETTLAISSTLIGGRDVERDQRLRLDGLESRDKINEVGSVSWT